MTAPLTDAQRALVEQVAHPAWKTVYRREYASRMQQDREDMVGDCFLALCRAAATFDPEFGATWKSYAIGRMFHIPTEFLRREDPLPRTQRDREDVREETARRMGQTLGRRPLPQEVAAAMGISETDFEELRTRVKLAHGWHEAFPLTLSPYGADDGGREDTWEDSIPGDEPTPEQEIVCRDTVAQVSRAIDRLPTEIRRTVARRVFLDEAPMCDVAREIGRSESRVFQIVHEIRNYLRPLLAEILF